MKRARLSPLVPQTPKAVSPSKPPLGSPWQGKTWPESRTCRPLSSWSTRPELSHVWGHTLSWPWGSREGLSLTASRLPQCDLCLRTKHPLSPQKKLLEAPGPPAAPSPACPGCCCREMCLGRQRGGKSFLTVLLQEFVVSSLPFNLHSSHSRAGSDAFSYLTGIFTRRYRSTAMARSARMELSVRMRTGQATMRQV